MTYTESDYDREKAICEKAEQYFNAYCSYDKGGWRSLSAELAKHSDYTSCDNDMRGRIEAFELIRDKPERFSAYVTDKPEIMTFPGNILGTITYRGKWNYGGFNCKWRQIVMRSIWGKVYYGREYNTMQLIRFRAYKES